MTNRFDYQLYESGLSAHGCWEKFDEYDREALEKFAELIIKECIAQVEKDHFGGRESWDRSIDNSVNNIKTYFGVQ